MSTYWRLVTTVLLTVSLLMSAAVNAASQQKAQQWLNTHSAIKVGVADNLYPLISIRDGKPQGFDVDVLKAITLGLDIEFVWVPCGPWKDCIEALKNERIDVLTSLSYSTERAAFAHFTERYWTMPWAALSINHQTEVNNQDIRIQALEGQRIGVIEEYSVVPMLRHLSQTEVATFQSISDGITALQRGTIDRYVDSLPVLVYELQQHPVVNGQLQVLTGAPGDDLFFGVRQGAEPLVSIFNQGIQSLSDERRQQLRQRWYGYELQQGWSDEELLLLVLKIASIAGVIVLVVAIWNGRLRREVRLRKAAERHIRHIATHDELTHLPNRKLLNDRLEQTLFKAQREHSQFAVMFLDLDGFKAINDDFGHEFGDLLLVQAAQRLTEVLRKSDTVCRYGGDEFVLLLPTTDSSDHALAVAQKLAVYLAKPYDINGHELEVSVSIGVAMYPDHGDDQHQLLRAADKAMYEAKDAGKNGARLAS